MSRDPRLVSFRLLRSVILQGRSLEKGATTSSFSGKLVRGVLKNFRFFKTFLKPYLSKRTDEDALIVLSMGLYQMFFMGVPSYASINESVKLVERLGKSYLKGFVNGVLRRISRDLDPLREEFEDLRRKAPYGPFEDVFGLRVRRLLGDSGFKRFVLSSLHDPPLTIFVNTLKIGVSELAEVFQGSGLSCERTRFSEYGLRVFGVHSPSVLPGFKEGFFFVQDESSQIVSRLVSPLRGERVLDVGAFPGGKTASMQIMAGGSSEIWAIDPDVGRAPLFDANMKRLHIKGIKKLVQDFRDFKAKLPYHRGLLDAPCSSLGIFGRRPDTLYTRRESDISGYQELQIELLETLIRSVRRGGFIVYSVCTGTPEETLDVVSYVEGEGWLERVDPGSIDSKLSIFTKDGFLITVPPGEDYYMDLIFSCVWRKT